MLIWLDFPRYSKTMRFHITKILEVRPCVGIVSTSAVPACSNWRTPWHLQKFMAFLRALIKARHAARKSWSSEREMILALRATQERRGFKHMFRLCFKVPNVGLNAFQHKHLWVANHKPGNQVGILILLFDFVLLWEPLNNESYRYTIFEYFRCVSLSTALCRTVGKTVIIDKHFRDPCVLHCQEFKILPGILACVIFYPLCFVLNFSGSGPSRTLSLALHPPGTLPQQCLESQWQVALDNPNASAEWILDEKHQKTEWHKRMHLTLHHSESSLLKSLLAAACLVDSSHDSTAMITWKEVPRNDVDTESCTSVHPHSSTSTCTSPYWELSRCVCTDYKVPLVSSMQNNIV